MKLTNEGWRNGLTLGSQSRESRECFFTFWSKTCEAGDEDDDDFDERSHNEDHHHHSGTGK